MHKSNDEILIELQQKGQTVINKIENYYGNEEIKNYMHGLLVCEVVKKLNDYVENHFKKLILTSKKDIIKDRIEKLELVCKSLEIAIQYEDDLRLDHALKNVSQSKFIKGHLFYSSLQKAIIDLHKATYNNKIPVRVNEIQTIVKKEVYDAMKQFAELFAPAIAKIVNPEIDQEKLDEVLQKTSEILELIKSPTNNPGVQSQPIPIAEDKNRKSRALYFSGTSRGEGSEPYSPPPTRRNNNLSPSEEVNHSAPFFSPIPSPPNKEEKENITENNTNQTKSRLNINNNMEDANTNDTYNYKKTN